jgi:hypothetical protein
MSNNISVISFDVGIRHLAYCYMTRNEIMKWDVIDLGPVPNVETCAERLLSVLDELFKDLTCDVVLIERQPKARSIIMVAVQMFLCSFFTTLKLREKVKEVKFMSAQWKLEMAHGPKLVKTDHDKKEQYKMNKKYAMDVTRHYLEVVMGDFGNLMLFDMYAKKDDLADAFLQGMSYFENSSKAPREFKRKANTRRRNKKI